MPPRSVNHLADIFSLGKVLQELVVGKTPVNADMAPGPLRPIIIRATATRADQHYASVQDFLTALETAIRRNGETPELCERLGLTFLPFEPLGGRGPGGSDHPVWQPFHAAARELDISWQQLAIAWLLHH
jgi:hypothetical protein